MCVSTIVENRCSGRVHAEKGGCAKGIRCICFFTERINFRVKDQHHLSFFARSPDSFREIRVQKYKKREDYYSKNLKQKISPEIPRLFKWL